MAGNVQPSIFDLRFEQGNPAEIDETAVGYVNEGHPFTVRCLVDDSYTAQVNVRKRNEDKLHEKEYADKEFKFLEDEGVYECEAKPAAGGELHIRRIHILPKVSLQHPNCSPPQEKYCGYHGACAIVRGLPTCYCPPGFVGERCEHNLIKEYFKSNTVTMAAGAGGTLTFVLFIVIATLTFFLIKEKRRTRHFFQTFGPLPERNAYGEFVVGFPENPYKKMSAENLHETRRTLDSPRNAFRSPKTRPGEPVATRLPLVDISRREEVPSIP